MRLWPVSGLIAYARRLPKSKGFSGFMSRALRITVAGAVADWAARRIEPLAPLSRFTRTLYPACGHQQVLLC